THTITRTRTRIITAASWARRRWWASPRTRTITIAPTAIRAPGIRASIARPTAIMARVITVTRMTTAMATAGRGTAWGSATGTATPTGTATAPGTGVDSIATGTDTAASRARSGAPGRRAQGSLPLEPA